MAVPCVPRKRESRPAMTSAAIRPCRLAGPAEGDQTPLAGDEIFDFDGITDGKDIGIAGAHLVIDANAAAFTECQSGHFCQGGVGAHAEGEDDDISRIGGAGLGLLRRWRRCRPV